MAESGLVWNVSWRAANDPRGAGENLCSARFAAAARQWAQSSARWEQLASARGSSSAAGGK